MKLKLRKLKVTITETSLRLLKDVSIRKVCFPFLTIIALLELGRTFINVTFLLDDRHVIQLSPLLEDKANESSSFDWKNWTLQEETKFLYLHVGKTAGTSIFCNFVLPRSNSFKKDVAFWCKGIKSAVPRAIEKEIEHPPLYSQKYGQRLHMNKMENDITAQSFNVFLVSLRNPYTRFISAYEYEKNKGHQWVQKSYPAFKRCFPNSVPISEFLLNIDEKFKDIVSDKFGMNSSAFCRQLGAKVVKGEIETYRSHMTYNYRFYENQMLFNTFQSVNKTNTTVTRNHQIIALRTEHLKEDFENLEIFLKTGNITSTHLIPNKTNNNTNDKEIKFNVNKYKSGGREISSDANRILCQLLCKDIQSYKRFLFCAENLSKEMVSDSMQELYRDCPTKWSNINDDCKER